MKIQLGYVAISKTLEGITSSHTISYTNYLKENKQDSKIDEIICHNLENLEKIIDYNIKNNIHFYRLTSALIPLATMTETTFDYIIPYQEIYKKIGDKIKKSNMRVDFHPDQFTVINSTRIEVIENTLRILNYHLDLLEALGIEIPILVLHIGSSVFGKEKAMKRFIYQFQKLPIRIQKAIVLENDDKTFTVEDCLWLCEKIKVPMVLDVHHDFCNPSPKPLIEYCERIFSTWKNITPKIHISSPKNKTKKEIRSHHDFIDIESFLSFIESIKHIPVNIDIMIEAKAKDEALFRLIRQLKYQTNYEFIDETSFIV